MFKRLWEQIDSLMVFASVSLMFGIVKLVLSKEKYTVRQVFITVLISILVGTLAGAVALEYGMADYTALTVSSVSSLLSRDIVVGILSNKDSIGALIKRASENLVDKVTK